MSKRKKKRKRWPILLLLGCLIVGCAVAVGWMSAEGLLTAEGLQTEKLLTRLFGSSEEETKIAVAENQRLAQAYVVSIVGNELTIMEYETESETESSEAGSDLAESSEAERNSVESGEAGGDLAESSEAERNSAESGEAGGSPAEPETEVEGRQKPAGFEAPSGGAEGFEMPSGEAESRGNMQQRGGFTDQKMDSQFAGGNFVAMETKEIRIPVGTTVHTTTGTTTTFSRIAAGDTLNVLYETNADGEEVVVEVWMVDLTEEESAEEDASGAADEAVQNPEEMPSDFANFEEGMTAGAGEFSGEFSGNFSGEWPAAGADFGGGNGE